MKLREIALEMITAEAGLFDLYQARPDAELTASIREHGVLAPVHGVEREGGIELMAGFRRLRAARAVKRSSLPVLVHETAGGPEHECAVCLHLAGQMRQLPVMALARLVRLAEAKLDDPLAWVCRQARPEKFSMNQERYTQLKKILKREEELGGYFEVYDAPLNTVVSIMRLADKPLRQILSWARGLHIRPVELEQIISEVIDGAAAGGCEPEAIIRQVLPGAAGSSDRRRRTELLTRVKQTLTQLRYPELAGMRAACVEAAAALKQACGIEAGYDPTFEQAGITVTFRARSEAEIKGVYRKLNRAEARQALEQLFSYAG